MYNPIWGMSIPTTPREKFRIDPKKLSFTQSLRSLGLIFNEEITAAVSIVTNTIMYGFAPTVTVPKTFKPTGFRMYA
jgi:hypothetical protein